jgi:leucyl aminopeptidase
VGLVGVGQGSTRPPYLAHVRYRPPGAKRHLALVGKGVTFDSGGLSLKTSAQMQTMRCDMGGAATALGALAAAAEAGLPIALDAVIACVENMNDGNAYKLGDVLAYRNGVTVEIHNTDAEGRLVLADALIDACREKGVTDVVDLATLTGAVVVAIGGDLTGLFTPDDALAGELLAAAGQSGEGLWRMPLHEPYRQMLKAEWAQIKNVTGKPDAGSVTAALFLQHFVEKVRWAHLDIAGGAWADSKDHTVAAGATGAPMRTVLRWIESRAS